MSELLTAVALLFIVAGPFLLVANRFDLPTVPFLILAGIAAGFIVDESQVLELAQIGIALLVFSFGIGIDLSGSRMVLRDSEIAAFAQIVVVGAFGVAFGVAVGVPLAESAYLGIAAALSSTIVGTALLQTEIRRSLVRGRLTESIQLVQDLFAILVLLVLGAGTLAPDPIALQIGYGVSLLILAVVINRYLYDVVDRLAGDSDELMIIGGVSLRVVFVIAAALAGVSIVVGAFAAGLAVRHDPVANLGLFNGIESIKDFFLAVFFVTVGALVVVPFLEIGSAESVEKLAIVAGLVFLTAVLKPAITTAILIYRGYESRSATLTSLSIDQVSEFASIIAIEALIFGLLTQRVFDAIILAAAVTMITSSLTQRHNERIYRTLANAGLLKGRHDKIDDLSTVPDDVSDHVVIAGYGRQGQGLAETCAELDRPFVVIENDPLLFDTVATECDAYVFGDAMERYTWEKASVEDATLVVSTINSDPVSNRLLSLSFEADLMLRTNDVTKALEYLEGGALYVSISDLLAGEQVIQQLRSLFETDLTPAELRAERLAELDEYVEMVDRSTHGEFDD